MTSIIKIYLHVNTDCLPALPVVALIMASQTGLARDGAAGERKLGGKSVAILVTDGFEQVELTGPRKAPDAAGAGTVLISPHSGQVPAWNVTNWGDMVRRGPHAGRGQARAFRRQAARRTGG
jgi:hypothetical protein